MKTTWRGWALGLIVASAGWASTPAHPGTLNYVEGQATIDGRAVTSQQIGSASVDQGAVLATGQGRAEMLLTPGVFLRIGDNSSVRMISPGLTDTRVEVLHGTALVEATNVRKENHLRILDERASVELLKNGLYRIDGDRDTVAVFDGKAAVNEDDRRVEVKSGREVNLNAPLKAEKFDKNQAKETDPLYQWSKVRSDYVQQANVSIVGAGYSNPGWYWDPGWRTWGFVPYGGAFYSPFGLGFYSPWDYWGYGGGYYYPPTVIVRPGRAGGYRGPVRGGIGHSGPAMRSRVPSGGFGGRSAGSMSRGGGGMAGGRSHR